MKAFVWGAEYTDRGFLRILLEGMALDCSRCGKCCAETCMQLSPQDIRRLERIGYSPGDFSTRKGGFRILRNIKGVCYFFDRKTRSCRVYAYRPEGCRYYPIVYSVDEGKLILDEEVCRRVTTITAEDLEKAKPGLTRLARKLLRDQKS